MENRSLKELYEITITTFRKRMLISNHGICESMCYLIATHQITGDEYDLLSSDFEEIMPRNTGSIYSWPLDDRQSRIEFLENRIKELSK